MSEMTNTAAAIKTIIDSLTGAGKTFNIAFDYLASAPRAFPAVMLFTLAGSNEVEADTVDNELVMRFVMRVFILDQGKEEDESSVRTIIDTVMGEFRKDDHQTLGGIVEDFFVEGFDVVHTQQGQGNYIITDFLLRAKKLVPTNL